MDPTLPTYSAQLSNFISNMDKASAVLSSLSTREMIILYHGRHKVHMLLWMLCKLNIIDYDEGHKVWYHVHDAIIKWYNKYNVGSRGAP